MTIMDTINAMTVAAGGTPSGGSIVDCINNLTVAKGGQPSGGSIADAINAYNSIPTEVVAETPAVVNISGDSQGEAMLEE